MADKAAKPETNLIDPRTVYTLLDKFKPELEAALPRHLTPARLARIALTELRKTPKLFRCTRDSFLGSLLTAAQLGLEPGVLGQCFLVPYKEVCTLIPGWRGYMDLLSRTERASAWTGAIFDGDEYDYALGDQPFLHHKPGPHFGDPTAMMYTYAVGRVRGMEWPQLDIWDIARIWKHRDAMNKCFDKSDHYSFKHPEMYARKIPLLQVLKYLPSSVELARASELDVVGAEGKQRLTLEGAIHEGNAVEEAEIEQAMEALDWDQAKRDSFRDAYSGRAGEALAYLKGELQKAKPGAGGKTTQPVSKAVHEPAQQKPAGAAAPGVRAEPAQTAEPAPAQAQPEVKQGGEAWSF